jgi:predicted ATPase/class 3 adenylate cyclase
MLPTGTVTFLFTDIAGSTNLWEQQPDAMKVALARHDALMRQAIESHDGTIVKTTGDGVHAAFTTASDALNACLAAQRALNKTSEVSETSEVWPLRVRMGLHTGAAELRDGDYYSSAVNRAARVMSVAHGGQIVLSNVTAELLRGSGAVPQDVMLRGVGEHRLKGLLNPEHLWQVVAPDLPQNFPPLASLNTIPNNLPIQVTSFVGRAKEIAEVKQMLSGKDLTGFHASRLSGLPARLVTLTGSGGTGKTRLSLQVAAEVLDSFKDGVWFVELAPLTDPALVPITIASVLGVREEQGRPLLATLMDWLHHKQLLFILDNCEHLIEACAQLADAVLHASRETRILASSREALGIAGESAYRVPSLAVPPNFRSLQDFGSLEQLTQYAAVRLFIDRATQALATFSVTNANAPAVAQICYRLDGIPLALELAAARVKVLRVEQIAARLDDRFRLLTGGSRTALPRQQTLRSTIDWSHSLLTELERVLLRRLSVFAGGWTLEAAEQVMGDGGQGIGGGDKPSLIPTPQPLTPEDVLDLLTHLVDKSLVVVDESGEGEAARYRMLETIRQYAREKLADANESEGLRDQHLDFFLKFAEDIEPKLSSAEQDMWFNRLEMERDNLRAAITWSLQGGDATTTLRLVGALWWFWRLRGPYDEGRKRLDEALSRPEAARRTVIRANALIGAAALTLPEHDYASGRLLIEEALSIGREVGDRFTIAKSLQYLGRLSDGQGEFMVARSALEESVAMFRELGDEYNVAWSLVFLGDVALRQADDERAQSYFVESAILLRKLKDKMLLTASLRRLGQFALNRSDYDEAAKLCKESLNLNWQVGDREGVAACLAALGEVALSRRQIIRAVQLFGAVEFLLDSIHSKLLLNDHVAYHRNIAALRAQLSAADFNAAWAAGRQMTMEQAVAYAMEDIH